MGNSRTSNSVKSLNKKAFITKLFSLIAILFCSLFGFIGCETNIQQNTSSATYDSNGNLRILTPQITYNYNTTNENGDKVFDEEISGSISWNLSYYAKNAYSPEADEQYLGIMFYTEDPTAILSKKNPSQEEKDWLTEHIYQGDISAVIYQNGRWTNGAQTLYRYYSSNIEFPNYEVVVDGTPLIFELHNESNYPTLLWNEETQTYELNLDAFYFTYINDSTRLDENYIKIIKDETNRNITSAESGIPFGKYIIVFNPQLKGTSLTRTIKVKSLAKSGSGRGDSPYSSTITYQATKLVFSVYSPNSADDLTSVGYFEYNEDAYYFNKIKTTVTSNPADAKPIYLEGYFPEGRVVEISRKQVEGTDFALSSWTTNTQAKYSPVLQGTLPVSINNFFNYISNSNKAINETESVGAFVVSTIYNNQEKLGFGYLDRATQITTANKENIFFEELNILNTATTTNPTNLTSTLKVVAVRNISGYTFYANYSKVKNFTQSGTVFAGDEFFNGNSNHYLTNYYISIYQVQTNENGYVLHTNDTYALTSSNELVKTNVTKTIYYNVTTGEISNTNAGNGRIIEITININGSTFEVTGLEHNMCLIFDKVSSNNDNNDTSGVKTSYTFHNATMSSVLLGETIIRSLFVAQSDKVLSGVIGTEYAESSNIEVIISQVDDDNNVSNVASDVKYEIIKSVTTKEDIHGYVTTNVILSIIVPENHLLVSYNVETPLISSQILYKLCDCPEGTTLHTCQFDENNFVYFNATTDTYYFTTQTSISKNSITVNGTSNYLMFNGNLYAYNYRDSSLNANGTVNYHSYYYGNYQYADANNSDLIKFESIVVTTTGNTTTYALRTHTVLNDFSATETYPNVNYNSPYVNSLEEANKYLENNLTDENKGILINNSSDSLAYFSTVYYFTRENGNLEISTYVFSNSTNSDISTNVTAFKSGLKYEITNANGVTESQDVYFYYDVVSKTRLGETKYYYTAPIGRSLSDGTTQWFYNFTNFNNINIVLGKTILENKDTTYATFYELMGEKIVNHYFYYVAEVTKANVQARQYNTIEKAEIGWVVYDKNGNVYSDASHPVQVYFSTNAVYKEIAIGDKKYRVTFDAQEFKFIVQDANGIENNNFNISFDMLSGGTLFNANGDAVQITNGNTTITPDLFNIENFKSTGTFTQANGTTGVSYSIEIGYEAINIETGEKTSIVTCEEKTGLLGTKTYSWAIDGVNVSEKDLEKYFIFPTFKVNGSDAYIKISSQDNPQDNAVVTNENKTYNPLFYYLDDNNEMVFLVGELKEGSVYVLNREAFILNETTNEKTQIMIWGKYIPTSDPNEPIIYPSFSSLIDYDDYNSWIFDPINGFYYDIDYSSNKAIKEGYLGSYWLAGSPYPNPVLYLSVRHKINEYARINIAVEIKSVFYAEIMADKIENDSSNVVLDFSTYSFKDTLVNIDANDYINNIYYVLNRTTLSHITAYKIVENNGKYQLQEGYEDGLILKVNELYVAEDGSIYWTDSIDANGQYLNKVYVKTDVVLNSILIGNQYYRPLDESECFVWKTSKKYVKDVGYFDVHGYTEDMATGTIIFNSGELDINDVCMGLNGLVLGTVNNIASDYNYDEVIIAGTTTAYRTSFAYASNVANMDTSNQGFFGLMQTTAIPIIDSYNTNETYFLMGKECLMLITDPIINTDSKVYYRFLEWRIYTRYNSGIIYYDRAETEKLGNNKYSSTLLFSPENAGHYVILPVYQRVFEVSYATEVENGPQNQGGSVVVYYKNGASVNIDNTITRNTYSVEYLQTSIGGNLGYYYKNITFTPYVYFDEIAQDEKGNLLPNTNLQQIIKFGSGNNITYFGIFADDTVAEGYVIKQLQLGTDEDARKGDLSNKLFELTFEGLYYYLTYQNNATNRVATTKVYNGIGFAVNCEFSQPFISGDYQTYSLYQKNNYLYIIDAINNAYVTFDEESPIAKTDVSEINIVEILEGLSSNEYGDGYLHVSNNDLLAGQNAYDEEGNLLTYLNFKTSYIDRESQVMLVALPDDGYRLLGWYTVDGKSLEELFGDEVKTFSQNDKIIRAYKYNGSYYYTKNEDAQGNVTYSDKVPDKLLYKVRGYYINKGTEQSPSYVEVFYSPRRDTYYYDTAYTLEVEAKYIKKIENGQTVSLVLEMPHYDAITSVENTNNNTFVYFLNEVQVYKFGDDFYKSYSTGNIEVSGNTLIIKSLHSNIEFVAVFREVYQSLILTDSEDEFGITIEGIYYFNNTDNSLANRLNENGEIIKIDNDTTELGYDISALNINPNTFKLFDIEDENNVYYNSIIPNSLINTTDDKGIYNGYVALSKSDYASTNAWLNYVINSTGMIDAQGQAGKQATLAEGETSFALKNIYFDDNTTALIVVKTLSSSPLQLHTLGLPNEYNLQPIIYPSDEYITSNSTKPSLTNATGSALNYKADYLYYVFELTYNRNPENEYADLIVHPTREISVDLDILTGNYCDTYSNYYEIELTYTGLGENMQEKTNSVYFSIGNYFEITKINNKSNFTFINREDFLENVINALIDGIIDIDTDSYIRIRQSILGDNANYYRFTEFINYLNYDILNETKQQINISGVRLNQNYINTLSNALNGTTLNNTQKANLQSNLDELILLGLIEKNENSYVSLPITTTNNSNYINRLFESLGYLLVKNDKPDEIDVNSDKTEEYYNNFAYVDKYTHNPVGDGTVNIIKLTAITMYSFSIQSLTIDGYDENGNIIYSKDNAHALGNSNGYFEFYTAVGTNNRTYMGALSPVEGFLGTYYNGTLTNNPTGIKFTNHYIDTNPTYLTDNNLPNYVYKDFLLAQNSLILIEGLANESTNSGYQFMGWYQQKKINSIYDRFYDLNGNRLTVINENSDYAIYSQDGKDIIVYNKDDANGKYKKGDVVPNPSENTNEITTDWLYYINEKTLELYRQDGLLVDSELYEYKEWASMELVSTTYKYPYIALANADTIITALFKRVVEFNYSFNPAELSVTVSSSTDSLGNPLFYSVFVNKNMGDGLETLGENITNKQDAYNLVQNNYNSAYTFEIRVTGNFYIDATPTLTITPVGGFKLDEIINYNTNEKIEEFDANNNTVIKYSNSNSLSETNINTLLVDDVPQSTYDNTNLAGVVYATLVLNNIYNTADLTDNSYHISFTTKRVILFYTQIEGYFEYAEEGYTSRGYDFVLSQTAILNADKTLDAQNVYFDSRIFTKDNNLDLYELNVNNAIYSMSEGFLDEWIFNLILKQLLEDENNATLNEEQLKSLVLENALYQELLSKFIKTDANKYIYVEVNGNNLIFYGYFNNDFTDYNTLNITTFSSGDEKAVDHWYINAQTPSSISGADASSDLNENIEFPTIQNINFEKPTNTDDETLNTANREYNNLYVLSKENLVYHLRAIIETQTKQTIAITLQNSFEDEPLNLVDLGVETDTDNSYDDLIQFTYTGIKYASIDSDRNINTTEAQDNTNANGTITTKFHQGRYGTNTAFVISIASEFIKIVNSNTYANGTLVENDVYAFIGWVVNGELVSTDLSFEPKASGVIEARFVKIAKVTFVNGEDNELINMKMIDIESEKLLTHELYLSKSSTPSKVFGFYPDGNYYYAIIGFGITANVYPDDGYVLESVLYTNKDYVLGSAEPEFLEAEITYRANYPIFTIIFETDSIVKLNIREGYTLTINQLLFSDYNQTTKGKVFNSATLYNLYKLINNSYENFVNVKGIFTFAQGSKIKLEFDAKNQPYSFVGWYINNKLLDVTQDGNKYYTEFELTENTVVELRIVPNIYINIKASDTYLSSGTNLISNVILNSNTSGETIYNGSTPISGNQIAVKAGENLSLTVASNLERTFLGWYYLVDNEADAKLLSTEYEYIFTINADNPYLNNNSITLVAVFALTKKVTITKTLEKQEIESENNNYDVVVTYTNGYGKEVVTNLGQNSSITIDALLGKEIKVEAKIEDDNKELYFFEGFWLNGNIKTYDETYSVSTNSLSSSTTITANFLKGSLVTLTRRLNDDPYVGNAISLSINYDPSNLSGKQLSGNTEYVELGFKDTSSTSSITSNLTITYSYDNELAQYYQFVGWYINNKKVEIDNNVFVQVNENTLKIINPFQNLTAFQNENTSSKNTLIEARFAEKATIILSRNIDGNSSASGLSNFVVNTYYNTYSTTENKVKLANITLQQNSTTNSLEKTDAYKYTSIALTASRYAGFNFIGFKVNGEFIKNEDGTNNTNEVVYYYLGNDTINNEQIHEYKIEACYSKQYTLNLFGTTMGTSATVNINAPQTISEFDKDLLSTTISAECSGLTFVGFYDINGKKLGETSELTISNATLINTAINNQIFIEARFTKTVTITVLGYDKNGNLVASSSSSLPYGVTSTISAPYGFTSWALPNPDGSNRLVAYYSTSRNLTILPLENKTYYALCGSSVSDFSHSVSAKSVVTTSSNGLISDGSNYDELSGAYIKIEYKDTTNRWPSKLTVDFETAIKDGYIFIGWVAGAKYLNEDGYHYLPISNELTINAEDNLYNDIFAVFAPVSSNTVTLDSNSHLGSFAFNANVNFTQSGIRNYYVTSENNKTVIYTFVNSAFNITASAIDGYSLSSGSSSKNISTQRIVNNIEIEVYKFDNEERVGVVLNNTITTSLSNVNADNIVPKYLNDQKTTITTISSNLGSIKITNQANSIVTNSANIFDNLFIASFPTDENVYLAYYEITRVMDLTRETTYISYLKHLSFKVLDGAIKITPVFRKTFDVNIDNIQENITDKGNVTVNDVTENGEVIVTKRVSVDANENYRIAGLVIENVFYPIAYNENGTTLALPNNYNVYNYITSAVDDAGRYYLTHIDLDITSTEDVNIAFVYNKVVNINLVDGRDNSISYNLFTDGITNTYNAGAYTSQDNYLTAQDVKNLKNIEGDENANPKFLGYYYNNIALPDYGIDISRDTVYTIVANFAKKHSVTVYIELYNDVGTTKLNNITLGTYSSLFNTPYDGFRIEMTRLSEDTSNNDTVTKSIILDDIFNTASIEYYDNNNLVLNAFGNNYFAFAGWKDQNGNVISTNAAVNPNIFDNITELRAIFWEETRLITINTNYLGDEIRVGSSSTETYLLKDILDKENPNYNPNQTITLLSGRNVVITSITENKVKKYVIKYSVASCELGDTFYIIDTAFTSNYVYYMLTYEDNVYKFKNITQQNDKIISGYNYVKGGLNPPSATVQLKDFYQSQKLNMNAIELVNIQYTYAITDNNASDLSNIYIKLIVNNDIHQQYIINNQSVNTVYKNAIINTWVEKGDIVSISASKTDAFNTIGFGYTPLTYVQDGITYLNTTNNQFDVATTKVIGTLTIEDWQNLIANCGLSNLTTLFARSSSTETTLDSISNYSFIAESNIYFVADYIPIFTYNRKFINATLSATDTLNKLTNNLATSSNGNTFSILPSTPDSQVTFEYKSNTSNLLNILDKNNNLIGIDSVNPLTRYQQTEDDEYDESYNINTVQTNNIFDTTNQNFTENGIKAIVEQLANVSVNVGYINATKNSVGTSSYTFNHYETLFNEYLNTYNNFIANLAQNLYPSLSSIIGTAIDFTSLINTLNNFNAVQVQLDYFNNSFDALNMVNSNHVDNYDFEDADINFSQTIESFVTSFLKVGSVISVKTKVLDGVDNWFFKGFIITNSSSTNNINLFASGEMLTQTSSYNSYKIIPRTECEYDANTGYYTLNNITLSGDTQIVALYEKALLQVEVRLKNNNDYAQSEYEKLLSQYSSNPEKLEGQTIDGIDLETDQNSSSGKLASTTTTIVQYGEPAVITTINYPFGELIGWASNNYSSNLFAMAGGITEEYNNILQNVTNFGLTFAENQLTLINPTYARNNLYVRTVTENMVVGAYFAPMSYVISIEIKETDLAYEETNGVSSQSGYVSILDKNGDASYIETYSDENGVEFGGGTKYKIKSSLISVSKSLVPTIKTTLNAKGEVVPVLDENGNPISVFYLRYVTGEIVYDANTKPVEVIPNKIQTGELDEDGNAVYEFVELNSSNFYKESNITLFNYNNPTNISNYFVKDNDDEGNRQTFIKPGLISISYNNKTAIDLSAYKISAIPVDENGEVIETTQAGVPVEGSNPIANYSVNLIISAKPNVGFPTVKIITNSPSEDPTIISYTFDDTDYINKLKEFTGANSLDELSIYDRNTNHDISMISGFYNRMFENTTMLTDDEFKITNCNFKLTLVYARKATPLVAQIYDANTNKTYTLTNRSNSTESNIEFVTNNVLVYNYYIVENGAYIANKLLDLLAISDNSLLSDYVYKIIDVLHNFPKYAKDTSLLNNAYLFNDNYILSQATSPITNSEGLSVNALEYVFNRLNTEGLIDDSFNYKTTFKITQIDVLKWFTGKTLARSVEQVIDEDKLTDQQMVSVAANIANEWNEDVYNTNSSGQFNEFFVKSGDSVTTHINLSLKFQNQRVTKTNKKGQTVTAEHAKLYYNHATLTYKSTETLGRLYLQYQNNIDIVNNQLTNADTPNTWQKVSNWLSAVFNCKEHFKGTYIQDIISSCYPSGQNLADTKQIVNVLTIDDDSRLFSMDLPFWIGEIPLQNEVISLATGGIVIIGGAILATVATGGVSLVVGIIIIVLGDIISKNAADVDWAHLP